MKVHDEALRSKVVWPHQLGSWKFRTRNLIVKKKHNAVEIGDRVRPRYWIALSAQQPSLPRRK